MCRAGCRGADRVNGNNGSRAGLILAGLFAIGLIPLLATPVIPSIDFYNHVARFYVLSHVGTSSALAQYYETHWALLPDIGLDLIGTPLLLLLSPLVAGHVIAVGIFAVLFGGVLYLNSVLTGQKSLLIATLLLPLFYSYIMNWGFTNFLLGLGFAFWAAGWWISHRDRPYVAVPVSSLFAVAIFFTHGLAFALYGILVAFLEVGLFLSAPNRKMRDLVRSLSLVAVQAIFPILFFIYWVANGGHDVGPSAAALAAHGVVPPSPGSLGDRILRRLIPILRVEEGPAYWFDITTLVLQATAILYLLRRGRIAIVRPAWPLLAAAVATVAIGVPVIFGVGYITDRMPLFAALCLLSVLRVAPGEWTAGARAASGFIVAIVLVRLLAVAIDWSGYGQFYREYRSLAAMIPRGSMSVGVPVANFYHETDVARCEMFGHLLVAQNEQGGPLFGQKNQHPMLLAGRLKSAVQFLDARFAPDRIGNYAGYMTAAASVGFNYMLVCNGHLLRQPYPPEIALMAKTPHFALLRSKAPPLP